MCLHKSNDYCLLKKITKKKKNRRASLLHIYLYPKFHDCLKDTTQHNVPVYTKIETNSTLKQSLSVFGWSCARGCKRKSSQLAEVRHNVAYVTWCVTRGLGVVVVNGQGRRKRRFIFREITKLITKIEAEMIYIFLLD